jgi:hypothetical protein
MKAGIQGQEQGLILHLLERFGCTTPVGLNFLTNGLSALATQLRSLGRMGTLAGGVMGDQQEGDRYTGELCVCHRCFAHRRQYRFRGKDNVGLSGSRGTRVVRWDPDGRNELQDQVLYICRPVMGDRS